MSKRDFYIERDRRDEVTRHWHNTAVSRGDDRVILRAKNGELHSYLAEEIGFSPGSHGVTISTGTGMLVGSVFCILIALAAMVYSFIAPGATGGERVGVFFAGSLFAGVALLFNTYWRREAKAKRLRKQRGLPEPILNSRG